jgi:hypothetical protein
MIVNMGKLQAGNVWSNIPGMGEIFVVYTKRVNVNIIKRGI